MALPRLVELVDDRGLHAQGQDLEGDVFLLSVLRASPAEVAAAPGLFTPREWAAANMRPSSTG